MGPDEIQEIREAVLEAFHEVTDPSEPVWQITISSWFSPCEIRAELSRGDASGYLAQNVVRMSPLHLVDHGRTNTGRNTQEESELVLDDCTLNFSKTFCSSTYITWMGEVFSCKNGGEGNFIRPQVDSFRPFSNQSTGYHQIEIENHDHFPTVCCRLCTDIHALEQHHNDKFHLSALTGA